MYQTTLEVPMLESGALLDYKAFKNGHFILASEAGSKPFMTTMLTGVASKLWKELEKNFSNVQRKVIRPNGFFSASFIIEYFNAQFAINIERKFIKGLWLLLPGIAESPASYKVIIRIQASEKQIHEKLSELVNLICQNRPIKIYP